jgi:predicted enzyme related to lactoylglutathione lyase
MSEHKMPQSGAFCWNELATKDLAAAKSFYARLLGWQLEGSAAAGMDYNEIVVGGEHIGGMYQMTEENSAPGDSPHWKIYVAVDDVDAKAKLTEELGGKVTVPPMDVPNVGRFCVIADPSGASISLIKLTGAGD